MMLGRVEIVFHHALRAIPGDLLQHVGLVEPRLGIHIAEALIDHLGRLAGVFGEDREQLRRARLIGALAVGAGEGVVIIMRRVAQRA